ncbi:MAG: hypothetical protein KQJ78_13690 [Deltaproteobacteria bacterium]|nr:hypothetical protein [Deltaproteobacteria bacterium]
MTLRVILVAAALAMALMLAAGCGPSEDKSQEAETHIQPTPTPTPTPPPAPDFTMSGPTPTPMPKAMVRESMFKNLPELHYFAPVSTSLEERYGKPEKLPSSDKEFDHLFFKELDMTVVVQLSDNKITQVLSGRQ